MPPREYRDLGAGSHVNYVIVVPTTTLGSFAPTTRKANTLIKGR